MSDQFEQIKTKYISTFAQKINDLNAAWDTKDVSQLHELLHKLYGSSGGYGLTDLCTLTQQCMSLTATTSCNHNQQISQSLKQICAILQQYFIKFR